MLASGFQPEGAVSGQPYTNANEQSEWMHHQATITQSSMMCVGGGSMGYGGLPYMQHNEWRGGAATGLMPEVLGQGPGNYDWASQQPHETSYMPDTAGMPPYSTMPPQYGQFMPPQYGQYMPQVPPQYPLMDANSLARLASRIQWEQQLLYQQLAMLQAQAMYAGMPWNYYGGYMGGGDEKWGPGVPGVPAGDVRDDKSVSSRHTVTSVDSASAMAQSRGQQQGGGRRRELSAAERAVLDTDMLTRASGTSLQHPLHNAAINGAYSHQCAALIGLGFDPRHLATPVSPFECAVGGDSMQPQIYSSAGLPAAPVTATPLPTVPLTTGLGMGARSGLWGGPSAGELSVQGTVGSSREAGLATDTGATTDAHDVSSDYGAATSEDGRESWGIKSAPATPSGRQKATNRVQVARSHSRRRDRRRVVRSSTASSAKSSDASWGGRVTKTAPKSLPRPGTDAVTDRVAVRTDVTEDKFDFDPSSVTSGAEATQELGVEPDTAPLSSTGNTLPYTKGKNVRSKRGHFLLCGLSRNSSGSCPHMADNAPAADGTVKTKTPSPGGSSRQVTGASPGGSSKHVTGASPGGSSRQVSGHEDSELEKDRVVDGITRKLLRLGVRRSSGEANGTGDSEVTGGDSEVTGGDSEEYDSECSVDSEERIQIERMLAHHHGNVRESSISLNTQDFALYEQEFEATGNATRSTRLPPVTQQVPPTAGQESTVSSEHKLKGKKNKEKTDTTKIKAKTKQNCKLQ